MLLLGLARRPIVGRPFPGIGPGGPGRPIALNLARWLLLGLVWAGPLILAFASPVVPAGDVLPNHVAPAEHLRVFGQIASLATYPSPIYGPSRLFLGYSALIAVLATLTNLPAGLTVAAFTGVLIGLSIVGVRRIASAAFGAEAGFWALVAYGLTSTFVRLPDVRDSVVALPLAALALALLSDRVDRRPGQASPRRPDWLLAAAISGAILVHPLVGALTGVTVVILTLADPARHARRTIPALAASVVAVLPQLAVMIGLEPAPVLGVAVFGAAIAVAVVMARLGDRADWTAFSAPVAATGGHPARSGGRGPGPGRRSWSDRAGVRLPEPGLPGPVRGGRPGPRTDRARACPECPRRPPDDPCRPRRRGSGRSLAQPSSRTRRCSASRSATRSRRPSATGWPGPASRSRAG